RRSRGVSRRPVPRRWLPCSSILPLEEKFSLARESLSEKSFDSFANRRQAEALRDVRGESVDQQGPGLRLADAARAHIEKSVGVELADRRSVLAFDVIGQDFQGRRRVDQRLPR